MAGTIAFGTAWRQMTVRSGSPFRRAIVTYSLEHLDHRAAHDAADVASPPARAWPPAAPPRRGPPRRGCRSGSSDTAGNTWNTLVANSSTSAMPITNSGSAASTSVTVDVMWSAGRSRRIAVHTPIKSDSGIATSDATRTRNTELPTRSDSRSLTGSCVAADAEVAGQQPAEPLDVLADHRVVQIQLVAEAATRSGVASLPRIAVAASPGASTAANTISETSQSVRSPSPSRRRIELTQRSPPSRSRSSTVARPTSPAGSRRPSRCRRPPGC